MTRTPQQVFQHHIEALAAEDLDAIVADYADDAVYLASGGPRHGRAGIRQAHIQLLGELPHATWDFKTQVYADDVLLVEWWADAGRSRVEEGVDTFVFRDGLIRAQTTRYTLFQARI